MILSILLLAAGSIILLGFAGFALVSLREKERRAALISLGLAVLLSLPFFAALWLGQSIQMIVLAAAGLLLLVGLAAFFLPIGKIKTDKQSPSRRIDERDIMFARARLQPGSPQYEAYYAMRPENKTGDDLTRSKPGLLGSGSLFEDKLLFTSPDASFALTGALRHTVDGPLADKRLSTTPAAASRYIKDLCRYYGALDVGITELKPYHVYSHIGRGSGEYGAPLDVEHCYAVAFTVEMDYNMIGAAPAAQGSMESARQYVESARVAVQLAEAIRLMGYPARAHIDGNYRVICPLVARDAGLGEIGRMGLLMTPRQGPRVRLGVVTTDLPLIPDPSGSNDAVIDFCTICKKCANTCPSHSIPFEERQPINGALRWQIDSDTCFRYWSVAGTDCGVCMRVCPYSHPDNFYHNLIRRGIAASGAFRRLVNHMDDLFYGKKPAARPAPRWTTANIAEHKPYQPADL